jgi:DNA repair protein RadC
MMKALSLFGVFAIAKCATLFDRDKYEELRRKRLIFELQEYRERVKQYPTDMSLRFELGRRLLADWPSARWTVRSPRDVADRLVLQMGRLEREELRVVLLNTKNVVLRIATVYQGNVASSLVRVGELYRDAVRLNATGVILVHNHPSGDPTPSPADMAITTQLAAAGQILGIPVVDHVVIGETAYVSFVEEGWLEAVAVG